MHSFTLEFLQVGDGEAPLEEHLDAVAEALHDDLSVTDVSVGANLAVGSVEFDVSAQGTPSEALQTAMAAITRAIHAAGGRIVDPIVTMESPFTETFEDLLGEPFPGFAERRLGHWHPRRIELTDA